MKIRRTFVSFVEYIGSGKSSGIKGARVSINQKGTRTTISAPGTGLSHSKYKSDSNNKKTNTKNTVNLKSDDNLNLFPKVKYYPTIAVGEYLI